MAFEEVPKGSAGRGTPKKNYVGMYANKGQVSIKISFDVLARVGSPKRMRVLRGTGPDAGSLLLKPVFTDTGTAYAVSRKQDHVTGRVAATGERLGLHVQNMDTVECDFSVTDDGVLITIPDEAISHLGNIAKLIGERA